MQSTCSVPPAQRQSEEIYHPLLRPLDPLFRADLYPAFKSDPVYPDLYPVRIL